LKKRSGTRTTRGEPPEPTFFTDRDLGKGIPHTLRENGLKVESHFEHFPDRPDLTDIDLFDFLGKKGWVLISRDKKQRYITDERDAMMRSGVKCFYLVGEHPFHDLAVAFVEAVLIVRALIARHDDAFVARVYKPAAGNPQRVRLVLTTARWLKGFRG